MSRSHVPRALRQRILAESGGRCAYCHSFTAITGARHVIDHVVPEAVGGQTIWENLCVACHSCNEFKGARRTAPDPATRRVVPLFHPKLQRWRRHFRWSEDGSEIIGISSVGRATVAALQMNHVAIVEARRRWVLAGWHPPHDDVSR